MGLSDVFGGRDSVGRKFRLTHFIISYIIYTSADFETSDA